jgi:hypothetical protein
MQITIDSTNRVFVKFNVVKGDKEEVKQKYLQIINGVNTARNLGLTDAQKTKFVLDPTIGVPFGAVGKVLDGTVPANAQPGIPVLDTLNNELVWWVGAAKTAFANQKLLYLLKGDNESKFPTFEAVINALRRNEVFKYNLITTREGAPEGTELYRERNNGPAKK